MHRHADGDQTLVVERKCRATKTTIELWRNYDEFPWMTICRDHGGCVGHYTRKEAESWLSHPDEWCPVCKGEDTIDTDTDT